MLCIFFDLVLCYVEIDMKMIMRTRAETESKKTFFRFSATMMSYYEGVAFRMPVIMSRVFSMNSTECFAKYLGSLSYVDKSCWL